MVQAPITPLVVIPEERRARELRRAQEREFLEGSSSRPVWICLLLLAAWQLIGAAFMLASFNVVEPRIAEVLFSASFAVGYGGAFFSLIAYYVRCRDRGDF